MTKPSDLYKKIELVSTLAPDFIDFSQIDSGEGDYFWFKANGFEQTFNIDDFYQEYDETTAPALSTYATITAYFWEDIKTRDWDIDNLRVRLDSDYSCAFYSMMIDTFSSMHGLHEVFDCNTPEEQTFSVIELWLNLAHNSDKLAFTNPDSSNL